MESKGLQVKHCISINLNQLQIISIVDTYLTLAVLNNCAYNNTMQRQLIKTEI